MAQRYMHFSAFLPLFFLWREKISCFFLLLLSFRTNLEAYPLLLSYLLDVLLLLLSLQTPIIFSHARFTRSSNPQKNTREYRASLFDIEETRIILKSLIRCYCKKFLILHIKIRIIFFPLCL